MEAGINAAFNDNKNHHETRSIESSGSSNKSQASLNSASFLSSVKDVLSVPGNNVCCDCGAPDPCWASINLCITLCIECSGIHRSLGVHVSKVRSLKLDDWEPVWIQLLLKLGNTIVNDVYEHNVTDQVRRATEESNRDVREKWIKAKYIEKSFIRSSGTKVDEDVPNDNESTENMVTSLVMTQEEINRELRLAVVQEDLIKISNAIANGASINWADPLDHSKTCLHLSVTSKSVMTSEFLLLNGAKSALCDLSGRTALHWAVEYGNTG